MVIRIAVSFSLCVCVATTELECVARTVVSLLAYARCWWFFGFLSRLGVYPALDGSVCGDRYG